MSVSSQLVQGHAFRLMMIGLDTLSLPFVRDNLASLPVLARLINSNRLVETESSARLASASVWPSFGSGTNPGFHGQYFPFQWLSDKMEYARIELPGVKERFDFEPFWYELARQGRKVVVFDAAHVVEHDDIPCTEIVNWSYQSSGRSYSSDPELLKELNRRFGHRPIGPEVPVPKNRSLSDKVKAGCIASLRKKFDAIHWLKDNQEWDFFLAGVFDIHRAEHNLWPVDGEFASDIAPDALLDVFKELDLQLDRLLQNIDLETTGIIFFALNGMAENRAQDHFLDEILSRLNRRYRGLEIPVESDAKNRNYMDYLRRNIPYEMQYAAVQLLGDNIQDWVVNKQLVGGRKWQETLSFQLASGGEGYIRLNLKGRERLGCLEQAEKNSYIDWLSDKLREIVVLETNEALINDVIKVEDHFVGPRGQHLPDLVVTWNPAEPARTVRSPDIGIIKAKLETGRGGNHTGDSFGLFCGAFPDDFEPSRLKSITDYAGIVREMMAVPA